MVYKFIVFCRAKRKSEVNFVVTGIAQTKIGVKSIWIGIFLRNLRIEIDIRFNIFIPCIYNRLLLNILYVINQKYGLNL